MLIDKHICSLAFLVLHRSAMDQQHSKEQGACNMSTGPFSKGKKETFLRLTVLQSNSAMSLPYASTEK